MRYQFEALVSIGCVSAFPAPAAKADTAPIETPTKAPTDDRLTTEIIDAAKAKLKNTKHPERKSIVKAILAGKSFADKGERDRALQRVASWLAWGDPEGDPLILAEVLRPSLEAMQAESPDDYFTIEDAAEKIDRAQSDARRVREAEAAQNAGIKRALHKGIIEGSTPPSVPVELIPAPSQSAASVLSTSSETSLLTALATTDSRAMTSPELLLGRPHYTPEEMGDFRKIQEKLEGAPILPGLRAMWIAERGDSETLAGPSSRFGQERTADPATAELRFALTRAPRRALNHKHLCKLR